MIRRVEDEWLDHMASDDPRAIVARRDLRWVNSCMFHGRIMVSLLRRHSWNKRPNTFVDLGGGDGTFTLGLARRLAANWPSVIVTVVDRRPLVSEATYAAFGKLGWSVVPLVMDANEFLERNRHSIDIMITNLFLHHFTADQLAGILRKISRAADCFIACEPRRAFPSVIGARLLWALGCNEVTRHDARVSVAAGFNGRELAMAWPDSSNWRLFERPSGLFTHSFAAVRVSRDHDL
jgi:hypothetical protein